MKTKRKFTKKHIKALLARLKEYEAVLKEKDFEKAAALARRMLDCGICDTVRGPSCIRCVLGPHFAYCRNSSTTYHRFIGAKMGDCVDIEHLHEVTRKRLRYLRDRFKREGIL